MGKFSVRLDAATEKVLSNVMKKERIKTKNAGIEHVILRYIWLQDALQKKIRELNTLSNEYDELHSLTKSKIDYEKRIAKLFEKKNTAKRDKSRRYKDEEE